tara:strand:+ start:106 stop:294 length:189 start_codon:yes stop_codon:yes gene_type:complete
MKKYNIKNKKRLNYEGPFTIVKKWFKNGIEKCVLVNESGWEYATIVNDLEEIKIESNKNKKK